MSAWAVGWPPAIHGSISGCGAAVKRGSAPLSANCDIVIGMEFIGLAVVIVLLVLAFAMIIRDLRRMIERQAEDAGSGLADERKYANSLANTISAKQMQIDGLVATLQAQESALLYHAERLDDYMKRLAIVEVTVAKADAVEGLDSRLKSAEDAIVAVATKPAESKPEEKKRVAKSFQAARNHASSERI